MFNLPSRRQLGRGRPLHPFLISSSAIPEALSFLPLISSLSLPFKPPSMARVPSKHARDQAMDFQGFLNDLQDWEFSLKDKEKRKKPPAGKKDNESAGVMGENRSPIRKVSTGAYSSNNAGKDDHLTNYDKINHLTSNLLSEHSLPDATSEKEQGNEFFKKKKFKEAINCYSRSIALSPTAIAYANRAMAYIKMRRFQEAEEDCSEALNLDDRYVKAYSRRATARKELGRLKEFLEDAETALRLEPQNQEVKAQFEEAKSLLKKSIFQKTSETLQGSGKDLQKVKQYDLKAKDGGKDSISSNTQDNGDKVSEKITIYPEKMEDIVTVESRPRKQDVDIPCGNAFSTSDSAYAKPSNRVTSRDQKTLVQELASQAASSAMIKVAENITPPNTAYQFEASWRGFSGDCALQTRLMKAISPNALPQIFKNAMTAPILIDMVKCIAAFFMDDMDFAVNFLECLAKVPRFDILVMCLSSGDKLEFLKIWDEIFCNEATPIEYAERLHKLRPKYCLTQ